MASENALEELRAVWDRIPPDAAGPALESFQGAMLLFGEGMRTIGPAASQALMGGAIKFAMAAMSEVKVWRRPLSEIEAHGARVFPGLIPALKRIAASLGFADEDDVPTPPPRLTAVK